MCWFFVVERASTEGQSGTETKQLPRQGYSVLWEFWRGNVRLSTPEVNTSSNMPANIVLQHQQITNNIIQSPRPG